MAIEHSTFCSSLESVRMLSMLILIFKIFTHAERAAYTKLREWLAIEHSTLAQKSKN